jgi:ribosomal protein L40E
MEMNLIGYCGLYCGGCKNYQYTEKGASTDEEGGKIEPCEGCRSTLTTEWCSDCAIKVCNRERGTEICIECGDNPCSLLTNFMNDEKYPYHLEVMDNMKAIKEKGCAQWIKNMEIEYSCGICGAKNHWFANSCVKCGEKIKNGRATHA